MKKNSLKFFLPFEFDQAPRIWDPWKDTWQKSDGKVFIFDCYRKLPFDGILLSKSKFDDNKKKYENYLERDKNIKNLLKIPKEIELFGDCGAFQYKNELKPPYSAKEVLDYYQNHGFDMGCSIDHIIFKKDDKKHANKRYNITKKYAKECIELYEKSDYDFQLFGVVQGWDIQSYSDMIDFLYELGYEYLCIGGLVGLNKKKIKQSNDLTVANLIKKLSPQLKKYKKVHIFGRGNLEYLKLYIKSGITQFDNNIMRKSWTDEKRSYHFYDSVNHQMKYYTSLRIRLIRNLQGLHDKEEKIFNSLRKLSNNYISNEDFLLDLKRYYEDFNKKHKEDYKVNETLIKSLINDKPWQKCECDLCKKYGIHICIFRRRMRNTLRGFHNVYNYYLYLDAVRSHDKLINQKDGILKYLEIKNS